MKWIWFIILLICSILAAGCLLESNGSSKSDTQADVSYTVVDDRGKEIFFPAPPHRILCLNNAIQDVVFDLVAVEQIAAVSNLSLDPAYSMTSKKAAFAAQRYTNPISAEKILSLQPDIVFVSDGVKPELYQTLVDMKIPVFEIKSPESIEGIRHMIRKISAVVRKEEKGQQLIQNMDQRLQALDQRLQRIEKDKRKTVIELTYNGTFGMMQHVFAILCQASHVRNGMEIIPTKSSVVVSKERILQLNPDVLLLPAWNAKGEKDPDEYFEQVKSDPAYVHLKCIQQKEVYKFPEKYRYCTSHHIAEAAEYMAKLVYPEYF